MRNFLTAIIATFSFLAFINVANSADHKFVPALVFDMGGKFDKQYQSKLKNYLEVSGINNIEYIEIRESKDFRAPKFISSEKETRIFIAININKVRLIDN